MLCYESALLMDTKTKKTKRQKYIFLKHKKAKTKKILWCQGSFNVYLLPRYDMMSGMIWYNMYDVRYDIVWYDVREVSMFIFCPGMATALAPSGLKPATLVLATVTGKTWLLQQVKLGYFKTRLNFVSSSDLLVFFFFFWFWLLWHCYSVTGKKWFWLL